MAGFRSPNSTKTKLLDIYWLLPLLLILTACVGVAMIYSATGGTWQLGARQHLIRLIAGLCLMIGIALINIRLWFSLAYPAYIFALVLLIGVEFFGISVNGSQRWLDLGITRLQPSEIMKLALVMALARYYHDLAPERVSHPFGIFGAVFLLAVPAALVLRQPDLGTTVLLVATGICIMFLAGIKWRVIGAALLASIIAVPAFFIYGLQPYQKERLLTFLDPERDPTGASYHIIQSKIALGSGGVSGKGFQQGSQASLNYVPENRTDFIFTVIGEEMGLIGGLMTMSLYIFIAAICFWLAAQCRALFAKLLILGFLCTFILYVFINLAMVMGMAPVVGVPLPLISYGGTVMLTLFVGFGLVLSAHLYRNVEISRGSPSLF